MNKFILSFLLVLLVSSCETDFNVNADWDEVTILYGLLDQSNDLQYVKINKAFLGKEDALLMASNSDSSNFEPNDLEITIYKIKTSSFNSFDTLGLVTLSDTSLVKDPGLFPTDNNIIYKFNNSSDFLNSNFIYSIKVLNKISGNVVSSSTRLIDGFNFETFNPSFDFCFYN